ncbi:hypothetical protein PVAP13_2KG223260 [Panicum virgatum]|uniref:Uncharacterized protein n=1 Tax=Panicum virgatum TaxID=38727 RepID=A0A8T0W912_PANVG|nr:hypothetical protein PVAP13_2KG223260 [Panicum virgatum]
MACEPAAAATPRRRLPRLSRTRLLAVIPTPSLPSSLRRCLAGSAPLGRAGAGLRGGPPAAARSASARPAAEAACEPAVGRTGGRGGSSSPSSSAPSTPAPRRPPHSRPPSRVPSGGGWPDPRPPARGHDGGGSRGGPLPQGAAMAGGLRSAVTWWPSSPSRPVAAVQPNHLAASGS